MLCFFILIFFLYLISSSLVLRQVVEISADGASLRRIEHPPPAKPAPATYHDVTVENFESVLELVSQGGGGRFLLLLMLWYVMCTRVIICYSVFFFFFFSFSLLILVPFLIV